LEYQNPISSDVVVIRGPALVGVRGYAIVVRDPREDKTEKIPLASIRVLILYGKSIRVSTSAIDKLIQQRVPVVIVTQDSISLVESPHLTTMPEARWAQYRYLSNYMLKLSLARSLVRAKVYGYSSVARYLARKYGVEELAAATEEARDIVDSNLEKASSPAEILNVEALAGQVVWKALRSTLLSEYEALGFSGRNPRSRDPINQGLNYLHAIIYSISYRALVAAGLDPHLGALHREGYGRTPLVYDYSEQFKPIALRALVVAAKNFTLRLNKRGLLTKKSIYSITTRFMKLLHSGRPTPHKQVYDYAWSLRETFRAETRYKPYVYTPR